MNLRDLEYLVAVADHHHFGRAAEACFVSQPTLSTQLKKLETELGVALVERNPAGAMMTPAGEEIVTRARVVLAEADDIRRVARHTADPEAGSVRLGVFPTLGPYLLPHVVPRVHTRFPRLELLLVEEKTDVILRQLRAGRLDAGLLALPIERGTLHIEPLFTEDFVLAAPAGHPLGESDDTVELGALAGEHVLLLDEGHCLRDQALSVCQLAGVSEREGFRATSLETLRQMVAAGVGVTLLPELSVQPPVAPSPDVRVRHFTEPVPSREIAMVWRQSSVIGDLLRSLAGVVRDLPPLAGVTPVPGRGVA